MPYPGDTAWFGLHLFLPQHVILSVLLTPFLLTSITQGHFSLQNWLTLDDLHLGHLSASVKSSKTGAKTNSRMRLRQNLLLLQTCYNSRFLPRWGGGEEAFRARGKQILHRSGHDHYHQRQQHFLLGYSTLQFTKHFCFCCFTFISI